MNKEKLYLNFQQCNYSPWHDENFQSNYFIPFRNHSVVSADRFYILKMAAENCMVLDGDFVECGAYKGGTSAMLAKLLREKKSDKKLHIFDTFSGMPEVNSRYDTHKKGDFSDTSVQAVKNIIGEAINLCKFYVGWIPETFRDFNEHSVSFCHIDVDIYDSVYNSVSFFWPKLVSGGFMIFDDYGFSSCKGARDAVDLYFENQSKKPIVLPTGQCMVIK